MTRVFVFTLSIFPMNCFILRSFLDAHIVDVKVKVKEADLYSAFIEVPYTQGA